MQVVNNTNKSQMTFKQSINDQLALSDQNKDIESHIAQYGRNFGNQQPLSEQKSIGKDMLMDPSLQDDEDFVVIEDNHGNLIEASRDNTDLDP
jgi:hypothetical protein